MEQKLLLTAIATMAAVIVTLFRLLMSAHRQQIIAKDKEIDFLRQLSLRTMPRRKGD